MSGGRIAVTVIGGYLGAGKTTLLNHLLATSDERVAILVNDFGELNIDLALLEEAEGNAVTLANGCICCSLVDGLANALADIAELEPRPDRLVIEASGVADPAGVAAFSHRKGFRLDLVVVLVDGSQFAANAADSYVGETVRGQLPAADLLVVNKTDLADPTEIDDLLDELAPGVPRVHTVNAVLDPAVLIDLKPRAGDPVEAGHIHDHGVPFETWSFEGGVIEEKTIRAMAEALPAAIVRAKGVIATPDGSRVFQRVGTRWSLTEEGTPGTASSPREGSPDVPSRTQLVAIGLPGAISEEWLGDQLGSDQ